MLVARFLPMIPISINHLAMIGVLCHVHFKFRVILGRVALYPYNFPDLSLVTNWTSYLADNWFQFRPSIYVHGIEIWDKQ